MWEREAGRIALKPEVQCRGKVRRARIQALFFFKIYLFYAYEYNYNCLQTHQKRMMSDPIADGCESPCGCWELNSGLLEEQTMLLTAEPSLQAGSRDCDVL